MIELDISSNYYEREKLAKEVVKKRWGAVATVLMKIGCLLPAVR
jgi:hypothetical protein